ncbi:hypothetical protein Tco_0778453 [Tanacetum coccineum]
MWEMSIDVEELGCEVSRLGVAKKCCLGLVVPRVEEETNRRMWSLGDQLSKKGYKGDLAKLDVSMKMWKRFVEVEVAAGEIKQQGRIVTVQDTTEKISQIKDRLKAARDRQKSYADKRRKPLEFSVAPRFVGPFEIIEKVGPVAYRLDLLEELNGVHDTFHVSNLKKCLADPTLQVPLDEIRVDAKLNFVEEPVEILEREFKKLKRSRIAIVKVRWNSKRGPEFTWEREDQMKLKYPHLFSDVSS